MNEGAGSAGDVNVGEPQDATGGGDLRMSRKRRQGRERSVQGMQNMVPMVRLAMYAPSMHTLINSMVSMKLVACERCGLIAL